VVEEQKECVGEAVGVADPLGDVDGDGVEVPSAAKGVGVGPSGVDEWQLLELTVRLRVEVERVEAVRVGEGEGERVGFSVIFEVLEVVWEKDTKEESVFEIVGVRVDEEVRVAVGEGVTEDERKGEWEAKEDTLAVGQELKEDVSETVSVGEGVKEGVRESNGVMEGLMVTTEGV